MSKISTFPSSPSTINRRPLNVLNVKHDFLSDRGPLSLQSGAHIPCSDGLTSNCIGALEEAMREESGLKKARSNGSL